MLPAHFADELYRALARFDGVPVSFSLACAVVEAVNKAAPPDAAVDVGQFAPQQHKELTFQAERIRDVVAEIKPLHLAHWQETERYRAGLPFNPDYEAFAAAERAGRYVLFTVREHGRLVGNCALYLHTSTHTQTTVATEDTLFLLPEARRDHAAKFFVGYVEQALACLGVGEVRITAKKANRAAVLFRRWGYHHTADELVKFLR